MVCINLRGTLQISFGDIYLHRGSEYAHNHKRDLLTITNPRESQYISGEVRSRVT
jgi:hypothetical protein